MFSTRISWIVVIVFILVGLGISTCAHADYLSLGINQSQWSDNNSRFYLFPDLASCETGCSYTMSLTSDNKSSGFNLG